LVVDGRPLKISAANAIGALFGNRTLRECLPPIVS
jgi:hypothetical protein